MRNFLIIFYSLQELFLSFQDFCYLQTQQSCCLQLVDCIGYLVSLQHQLFQAISLRKELRSPVYLSRVVSLLLALYLVALWLCDPARRHSDHCRIWLVQKPLLLSSRQSSKLIFLFIGRNKSRGQPLACILLGLSDSVQSSGLNCLVVYYCLFIFSYWLHLQ